MLEFESSWRFGNPGELPVEVVRGFCELIPAIVSQGDRQDLLEHFKKRFSGPARCSYSPSSSASWAETDLDQYMYQARRNAPLFIEAFYSACEELRVLNISVPDIGFMNQILRSHNVGYTIDPPLLVRRKSDISVASPESTPSLNEHAQAKFQESAALAKKMLDEGRGRPAVQELLWLLESVSTTFKDVDAGSGAVRGSYFNKIVRELRKSKPNTTLERVLGWVEVLHGFLSSPTGGGIRHGADLNITTPSDSVADLEEARLYCNLILSYIGFLLAEHERLTL